jgi:hypothetical protein
MMPQDKIDGHAHYFPDVYRDAPINCSPLPEGGRMNNRDTLPTALTSGSVPTRKT